MAWRVKGQTPGNSSETVFLAFSESQGWYWAREGVRDEMAYFEDGPVHEAPAEALTIAHQCIKPWYLRPHPDKLETEWRKTNAYPGLDIVKETLSS